MRFCDRTRHFCLITVCFLKVTFHFCERARHFCRSAVRFYDVTLRFCDVTEHFYSNLGCFGGLCVFLIPSGLSFSFDPDKSGQALSIGEKELCDGETQEDNGQAVTE